MKLERGAARAAGNLCLTHTGTQDLNAPRNDQRLFKAIGTGRQLERATGLQVSEGSRDAAVLATARIH